MSLLKALLDAGAEIVRPLEFSRDRPRGKGNMWGGFCNVKYKNVTYKFQMWHHHDLPEDMERWEVIEQMKLTIAIVPNGFGPRQVNTSTGVLVQDRSVYDTYWNVIEANKTVFVNPRSWFEDGTNAELRQFAKEKIEEINKGNYELTDLELSKLRTKGFEILVAL